MYCEVSYLTEYLILYFFITFLAIQCATEKNEKRKTALYYLPVTFLVFLMGFRNQEMGVDLKGYLPSFERLTSYSWDRIITMQSFLNYEKGYIVFNKIIGSIYPDRQFFLFCCAAISILPVSIYIYKTSKIPLVSLALYLGLPCFLTVFSALRQAIAISICAISLLFIKNKKPLVFVILVLLAVTFHSSAILFLVAYPLYHYKPSRTLRMISVVLLPTAYLFRVPLFLILSKLIKDGAGIDNNNSITLFLVFTSVYIFSILFVEKTDDINNGWLNIFWAACFCQALAGLNNIAIRVGYYFMIPLIILLPNIILANNRMQKSGAIIVISNKKQRLLIIGSIYLCFVAFGIFTLKTGSWTRSNPYYWFWESYYS